MSSARASLIGLARETRAESVDLLDPGAIGRILARPVTADRDLPPFDRATMDGYAVRTADLAPDRPLKVLGESAAGRPFRGDVGAHEAVRIATGAPVPDALDAVVEQERVRVVDDERIIVEASDVRPGRSIHPRGVDAAAASTLIDAGVRIDEVAVGLAATVGATSLQVRTRPRIMLISTGDELCEVDADLDDATGRFRIRNGNAPMIAGTLRRLGAEVVGCRHVLDDRKATVDRLREGLDQADLVVTIGGLSVGDRDHVPAAWDELGLRRENGGVRIQPGRPATWWTLDGACRAFGLPGNPVSALVTCHLFVRSWIEASLGLDPDARWLTIELENAVRRNPRRPMARPAHLRRDSTRLLANVPSWQGSGDLAHLAGTDGVALIEDGESSAHAGSIVPFLPW